MNKFLRFDEMVTPSIINVVYWLGIAVIVLGALSTIFGGFGAFIGGLIAGAIGLIFWRVWCEIMIILFRMHGDLVQIARNTTPRP